MSLASTGGMMPESPELTLPTDPDALLTPKQVSALTQLDEQTLANMRWRKTGPTYLKFGDGRSAPVRYRRRDVLAWFESSAVAA
jgi:predicted DNA-binding transcriptional regulator AlpA